MPFLDQYVRDLLSRGQTCKVELTANQLQPCAISVISGHAFEEPLVPFRLLVIPEGLTVPIELSIPEQPPGWIRHDILILHYLHIPPGGRKAALSEVLEILEKSAAETGKWIIIYQSSMFTSKTIDTVAHSRGYMKMKEMGWVWHI